MKKYYDQLPPWAKGTVAVGALLFTGLALWKAYGLVTNFWEQQKGSNALKDTTNELEKLQEKQIVPSYPDIQYELWANAIQECFNGWGTCSGDTIFVNLRNDADMIKLIKAFGVRTISSGAWNPAGDTTGDLSKVIRDELSISQIEATNKILVKNGITFKF